MPGVYDNTEYLADDFQSKFWIRIQPETRTLNLTNRPNFSGGENYIDKPRIKVAGSRRGVGAYARLVIVQFTGQVPAGYRAEGYHRLPWLRPEGFSSLVPGSIGTYQDFPIVVIDKIQEVFR